MSFVFWAGLNSLKSDFVIETRAPRGTDCSPEYNEHFSYNKFLSKLESMTAIFVKSVRTEKSRYFNSGYGMHSVCCCCIPIWRKSPLEKRSLTDLFNAPPVMHASGIYVTDFVPCLVNAVDFLLYKLHVLRAAVSSYSSSLHTLELHI